MAVQFHAFGVLWLLSVVTCIVAAAGLMVVAGRLRARGYRGAHAPLVIAAVIESSVAVADIVVRLTAGRVGDAGLIVLDGWTIARPLLHAAVLVSVAYGCLTVLNKRG